MDYFNTHPGVYFKTTGWIERGEADGELGQLALGNKLGLTQSYEEWWPSTVRRTRNICGKSSARTWPGTMAQMTFIEMGIEPDGSFEQRARDEAAKRGWTFEKCRATSA